VRTRGFFITASVELTRSRDAMAKRPAIVAFMALEPTDPVGR